MGNENQNVTPETVQFNLSDFALFLTVMKHREAYESTLSIITENPDLKLKEVHVEEVILNRSGKRAIRLDAWALDTENRQYAAEMQNDTDSDDIRKRARFYQGLIDSPILKSGKRTKYRHLPSTMIIFITQEDIFGQDLAKYTFTEQCEEIAGMHLEDGTTKVFLNMSSKNGTPELVSLLQYMKDTTLENPNIIVKDKRILKLAEIVEEVKQSEEWEAIHTSIYSMGIKKGREEGRTEGLTQGITTGTLRGKAQSVLELLAELGSIPPETEHKINNETDPAVLSSWLKTAARADSIESFIREMN